MVACDQRLVSSSPGFTVFMGHDASLNDLPERSFLASGLIPLNAYCLPPRDPKQDRFTMEPTHVGPPR